MGDPHPGPLGKFEALADLRMRQNHAEHARLHAIKGVGIHVRLLQAMVARCMPPLHEARSGAPADRYAFEICHAAGVMLFDRALFARPTPAHDARIERFIALMARALDQQADFLAVHRRAIGHSE